MDSIEKYANATSKGLVSEKEDIKFNNIIKEHNPSWPQIPNHAYILLIIWGFESRKTNSLFNFIIHQPGIDKIYLYAKIHMKQNINC